MERSPLKVTGGAQRAGRCLQHTRDLLRHVDELWMPCPAFGAPARAAGTTLAAALPVRQGGESPPRAALPGGPQPLDITFKDIKYTVKDRATGKPLEILKGISGKVRRPAAYWWDVPALSCRCLLPRAQLGGCCLHWHLHSVMCTKLAVDCSRCTDPFFLASLCAGGGSPALSDHGQLWGRQDNPGEWGGWVAQRVSNGTRPRLWRQCSFPPGKAPPEPGRGMLGHGRQHSSTPSPGGSPPSSLISIHYFTTSQLDILANNLWGSGTVEGEVLVNGAERK